jgi:hypothetical protein
MYFRKKSSGGRVYLQIVASRREGDRVRQQVIATLGRWDELEASGQLERLLRSGARFGCDGGGAPDRTGAGVRAAMAGDRLPVGGRGAGR